VTAQLAREGIPVNHKAVEAEMVRQGLRGRSSRRKMRTTRRDPSKVPALDLVGRDFERAQLDQLWIGDATYIWTDEGWLYLATVIDACSRRLLGWSITDHLRTELCLDAIETAVATRGGRRNLVRGVVFHTDHGTPVRTPPMPSRRPADRFASPSRWEPSGTVMTRRRFHIALLVDGWVESRLSRRIPCRFA
jgi:transposase InsO family protein